MRTEDGHIVQECLNGEPGAFGMLVDKYKEGIYAFAYDKLRNFQDAEDVTQEVFLQAYRSLRTLRRWESLAFWLYRIAYSRCADLLRIRSRRVDLDFMEDQDPEAIDAPSLDSYRRDQLNQSVRVALDSLPDAYREVLVLHYFGGMTIKDMARSLGASPAAIGKRLSRGRAQLKEDMIAMMSETFQQQKIKAGFTFQIVEMIKRVSIQPLSPKALPWGLSLATGLIIAVLGIGTHINMTNTTDYISIPSSAGEPKVLKIGELPVDVVNVSDVTVTSSQQLPGNGLGNVVPDLQNALFMAPQAEVGTWTRKADMPTARSSLSVCTVNGKIYAIGGWDGRNNTYFSTVEEYDPVADGWKKRSDKPTPDAGFYSWVMDNRIYTFNTVAGEIEQYEPEIDRWTKWRNTDAVNSYFHSVSFVNGKVYVIGGCIWDGDRQIALSGVYEYDPIADKWAKKANMPTARLHLSTCVCNGKIYAIGGWDGIKWNILSTVEEYDPIADKWTKKANMSAIRHALVTCAVKGKIYAIGGVGVDDPGPCCLVEEYDPITDTWAKKPDMPTGRWSSAGCVVNGKIYVIGGTNDVQNPPPLSTLEVYDPGTGQSINSEGKLPTTWGDVRTALKK